MEAWLLPLQQGQLDVAWDLFLSRYRRLIFASIRHYTQDYDDGMDLFVHVCEKLRADGMRHLRIRAEQPDPPARLSTWLVAVVRHDVVDWFRHRDGRRRLAGLHQGLSPIQRRIFELVFLDAHTHVETYELLCTGAAPGLTFREFLAQLRDTYRVVGSGRRGALLHALNPGPPPISDEGELLSSVESAERRERLRLALAALAPEDRLAVELYLMEELPADRVARILGLANAKAVYNRVYRALAELRTRLEQSGIRRGDL